MEFRFAHIGVRKPIVIAVVGTGFMWESTEVKKSPVLKFSVL